MHQADADAHDQAGAEDSGEAAAALLGEDEGGQGGQHGQHEGEEGQAGLVADRRARIEAEHGYEVHGPDAGAHGQGGDHQPGGTPTAHVGPDAPKEVQGGPGSGGRHEDGEAHVERTMSVVHPIKLRGLRPHRQARRTSNPPGPQAPQRPRSEAPGLWGSSLGA